MTPEPQQAAAHQKRMREVHDGLEDIQQKLVKVSASFRQAESQKERHVCGAGGRAAAGGGPRGPDRLRSELAA